jgi:hypothetical protein
MGRNDSHLKPSSIGRLLFIGAAIVNVALFAQTTGPSTGVDLAAPMLKLNAQRPQHNPPGTPLAESLANGRAIAASKGFPWKGMRFIAKEGLLMLSPGAFNILQLYQKQACQADAIVVGQTNLWAYHLSAFGTAVYGDYDFVIDTLLKDNRTSSIRSKPAIVVTRPGGSLSLADGPVTHVFEEFPRLQSGTTYLLFLRYIPGSSAYEALDSSSTLVATGNNWVIARKAFSGLAIPEFRRGALEASISNWLTSCK